MDPYRSQPRDEISELIECYIIENNLKADDQLPSERKLCELWNCNRMTFRSAVNHLVAEGVLYSVPSKGNFVADKKLERYLQDLTSFSDFIMLQGYSIKNIIVSQRMISATKKIAAHLQIEAGNPVFELVRLRVVEDEPVSIEWSHLPYKRFEGIERYNFERISLYSVLEMKYVTKFEGGEEKISVTYADQQEAELLTINEGDALFFLQGVIWDEKRIPIEYIKSVSRSDKITFAGILSK